MDHRTAFVTGASSGIGWALARKLGLLGVEVALAARREDRLRQLEATIVSDGGRARVYPVDVADAAAAIAALRRADDEMDGIDLVVANAGLGQSRFGDELTWVDCQPILRVNVEGAVATLTAILDRMVTRRRGHLVGVSSLAQVRGLPARALYSGSKAFLSTFLEGLRVDLKHTGITVTDVRPGFVETPLTDQNSFPMPWIMSVDAAVDAIVRGIERRSKVVSFPWQLAALAGGARLIPRSVYDALAGHVRGWGKPTS
jgi:short-subunit dehydrogenase